MVTACIDGWNIALRKGSGIATYGHSLLTALRGLGVDRQVLYGPTTARHADPLMNEIALIDAGAPSRRSASLGRAVSTLTARFGRSAYPIIPSKDVIWPNSSVKKPDADSYWASTDVFNLANRAYQHYRTFTPVIFARDEGVGHPDVMHWTCPLPIFGRGAINIVTFHDIIPLRLPHTTADRKAAYYNLCRDVVDRADHILTVSTSTQNDLVRILGVNPDKITTTFQAIDLPIPTLDESTCSAALQSQLGLKWKDYFLFFGAVEPKKNLGRIVEAYLASGARSRLVIVGGRSWLSETETGLLDAVIAQSAGDRILRLDYLPDSTLHQLIRGARATLFPSLYEGFGLPVLESMTVGTPVLTSNEGALPEVGGDAAVRVDAYDVGGIASAIRLLDNDEDLLKDLAQKGPIQAAQFSMNAYRERLASAYRKAGAPISVHSPRRSPRIPQNVLNHLSIGG